MKIRKTIFKTLLAAVVITCGSIGVLICPVSNINAQGVGINPSGNAPNASAGLDVNFTDKGMLVPRVTTAQRDAINTPANSLIIFNTDNSCLQIYVYGLWQTVWCPGATCPTPAQPSVISGNASPCLSSAQNYSVTNVSGVTYTWTFPTGWTQTAGGTTNSVTVTVGSGSGNMHVTPSNGCGNGIEQTLAVTNTPIPLAPSAGTHVPSPAQIVWNWNAVSGATGYKWNTTNDYGTATDMLTATSKTEAGLICNTPYTRYVWAYNTCGNSTSTTLTQSTSACCSGLLISSFGSPNGWITNNPSANSDQIMALAIDGTGLYAAGYDAVSSTNSEWRIEKRSLSTGALITSFGSSGVTTNDPTTGSDIIIAVAIDGTGLYAAGIDANGGNEWRIEKRDLSTGALITTFGSGGVVTSNPSAGNDQVKAIAIDGTGLYVGGYSNVTGSDNAWRIEKRDLSTGALITSFGTAGVITDNPSVSDDQVRALTLDGTGLYAGGSDAANTNEQWRMKKLDLSTGSVLWSQVNNPSASEDRIYALAIDGTGLYLAGHDRATGNSEWRVEKRSLSGGTLITTFGTGGVITSEPSASTDEINAVAIDGTGLYVAGLDNVGGTGGEWRIEKRDLSTGGLITTFASGGVVISNPSTGGDQISAIAVDGTGVYAAGLDNVPGNTEWRIEKRCK